MALNLFSKIKKLFADNRLRDLLAGNLVITDEIANEFLARLPLPPPLKRLSVLCGEGVLEAEGEAELAGVRIGFQGGVELLEVRITAKEQNIRLMPRGPIRVTTPHVTIDVDLKSSPGLLDELRALLELAPPELVRGLTLDPAAIAIAVHDNPLWSAEFNRAIAELPLAKDFGVNPLDHVVINGLRIEPGAIRLLAGRP